MSHPSPASNRKITILKILISPLCFLLIYFLWKHNLTLWTIPVAAFLVFYYAMVPGMARAAARRFNRQAVLLLTRGRAAEVQALVRNSFFFRLTAPLGLIDAKLALAYLAMEEYEAALTCFDRALPYADPSERPTLMVGRVKALFATGDFKKAEIEGENITDRIAKLPELLVMVARSRIGQGRNDDAAKYLLDEAETLSPTEDVRLMIALSRIESALLGGRKVPPLPDDADSNRKIVRAWIHLVRGLLREKKGDLKKAAQSFEKASSELPGSFIAAEAQKNLAALRRASEGADDACDGKLEGSGLTEEKSPEKSTPKTAPKPAPKASPATRSSAQSLGKSPGAKPKAESSGSHKKKKKRR